jgi:superfamily II DNA/RNA helicase
MAPTRELAQQIDVECARIARSSGLRSAVLIGGSPMGRQLSDLKYVIRKLLSEHPAELKTIWRENP